MQSALFHNKQLKINVPKRSFEVAEFESLRPSDSRSLQVRIPVSLSQVGDLPPPPQLGLCEDLLSGPRTPGAGSLRRP